jgi:hypothetical protein
MDFLTPEEKKNAITKLGEGNIGSQLEDLIVAVWIVYGLTHDKPTSEPHQLAIGVINNFELHEFGWSRSKFIPKRLTLEGEDATLDERITQYCDLARKHEEELRPNLVMMLGLVYLMSRSRPDEMMHKWVAGAMRRHNISVDSFTEKNPLRVRFVLPDSDQIQ